MTAASLASDALLALAAVVALMSTLGVAAMKGAVVKLHYVSPISVVVPILAALGVTLREGVSTMSLQAWEVALITVVSGPLIAHATARALRSNPGPSQAGSRAGDGRG